jgi:hypothetical protein
MDPYIINNMPDEEVPVADLTITDDDLTISLAYDGDSYVLAVGTDENGGRVVCAFDPTIDLGVALAFLMVLRRGQVTGGSTAANEIATEMLAQVEANK